MTAHGSRAARALFIIASAVCFGFGAVPAQPEHTGFDRLPFQQAMAIQVALDRAGVSPGLVDGKPGQNTRTALELFQKAAGLPPTGTPDEPSLAALGIGTRPPLTSYTITEEDAAGPFQPRIPEDLEKQGTLDALHYRSILELLAERFHTSPDALRTLNPGSGFRGGDVIQVPDVEPMRLPATAALRRDHPGLHAGMAQGVFVSKAPSQAVVLDVNGQLLFAAPVTSGSGHDPLPLGEWHVRDVYLLPVFHYNPDLFWDADPSHGRTVIRPGPNNPVGTVWIDLDKEHYGLHGTPEPQSVGRSASHGCVRLTNWDALRLAEYVAVKTRVLFDETAPQIQPWPSGSR